MKEQGPGHVAHFGVVAVEVTIRQLEELLLQRDGLSHQLRAVCVVAAKAMPEPKQSCVERQRVAAKPIRLGSLSEVQDAEQIAFQMGAQQNCALPLWYFR